VKLTKKKIKLIKINKRAVSRSIYAVIFIVIIVIAAIVGYYALTMQNNQKDIVETAEANGSFNTLITALTSANLVDTLKGTGPFTVFAPTDTAFDSLPTGLLNQLLNNTTELTQVLTYHVVSGKLSASDVTHQSSVTSLEGSVLAITTSEGAMIGPAKITQTDIDCSNGVIHVIDKVLVPPGIMNIVQTAQYYDFSTIVTALQTAGLTSTLESAGPFTVFAPTNAAFDALPAGKLNELLADPGTLAQVLTYHVVSGRLLAEDVLMQTSLTTVEGSTVTISTTEGAKVNDANIVMTDILCSNGVVHVIDAVLLPP